MDNHQIADEEGQIRQSTANDDGGAGKFYGWPSSRIVRVSRASGGKDRHSKVLTSKGLRDRRVRLSVNTAIQFYDLQDRLGYDQPSKAVEWLLTAAASSIAELPPMNTCFPDIPRQPRGVQRCNTTGVDIGGNSGDFQREPVTKSPAGSSNSETSKGSGISIARSESRIKERAAEKDKEKDNESSYVSSFSELLSRRINCINESAHHDYFTSGRLPGPPATGPEQIVSSLLFSAAVDHHHTELQPFQFASDSLVSAVNSPGFATINRGTLQSNSPSPPSLPPSFPPPPNFFTGAGINNNHHFHPGFDARLQLYYGDAHGSYAGRHSGQKEKEKK